MGKTKSGILRRYASRSNMGQIIAERSTDVVHRAGDKRDGKKRRIKTT